MSDDDKPRVFISYSRRDAEWRDKLKLHLRTLRRFDVWDDVLIPAGDDWKAQIDVALERARAAVLLVSADFLASDFIGEHEVPPLLERLERNNLLIVPVIVRPCAWKKVPWLVRLQARPRDGRPLSGLREHEVEEQLSAIVEEIADRLPKPARQTTEAPLPSTPALIQPAPQPHIAVIEPPLRAAAPRDELNDLAAKLGVTLEPYEFETIRVDVTGEIIERRKLLSRMFLQDLGDGVTLEMVGVPSGAFVMGSPSVEPGRVIDEGPERDVTVAPVFVARVPVTQDQWAAIERLPKVGHELNPDPSYFKGISRPVECISWHDAMEVCMRLQRATGRTFRLPSEAEWEYVARAGTTTPFTFGPAISSDLANFNGCVSYGHARKGPNRQATTNVGAVGSRMGLACGMCMAMCGSGRWTPRTTTIAARPPMPGLGRRAATRACVSCEVVRGTTLPMHAGRHAAAMRTRSTGTVALAFASCAHPRVVVDARDGRIPAATRGRGAHHPLLPGSRSAAATSGRSRRASR